MLWWLVTSGYFREWSETHKTNLQISMETPFIIIWQIPFMYTWIGWHGKGGLWVGVASGVDYTGIDHVDLTPGRPQVQRAHTHTHTHAQHNDINNHSCHKPGNQRYNSPIQVKTTYLYSRIKTHSSPSTDKSSNIQPSS